MDAMQELIQQLCEKVDKNHNSLEASMKELKDTVITQETLDTRLEPMLDRITGMSDVCDSLIDRVNQLEAELKKSEGTAMRVVEQDMEYKLREASRSLFISKLPNGLTFPPNDYNGGEGFHHEVDRMMQEGYGNYSVTHSATVKQIAPNACIIRTANPAVAYGMLRYLRKEVKVLGWRCSQALPHSREVKLVNGCADSILNLMKLGGSVKNWSTYHSVTKAVYTMTLVVRGHKEGETIKLKIPTDIVKKNDTRNTILRNLADFYLKPLVDFATKKEFDRCMAKLLSGDPRPRGGEGVTSKADREGGPAQRLRRPFQLSPTPKNRHTDNSPPPNNPTASTPIHETSPPENAPDFPALPLATEASAPTLGLMVINDKPADSEWTNDDAGVWQQKHHNTVLTDGQTTTEHETTEGMEVVAEDNNKRALNDSKEKEENVKKNAKLDKKKLTFADKARKAL
jgi:hypothetical protein